MHRDASGRPARPGRPVAADTTDPAFSPLEQEGTREERLPFCSSRSWVTSSRAPVRAGAALVQAGVVRLRRLGIRPQQLLGILQFENPSVRSTSAGIPGRSRPASGSHDVIQNVRLSGEGPAGIRAVLITIGWFLQMSSAPRAGVLHFGDADSFGGRNVTIFGQHPMCIEAPPDRLARVAGPDAVRVMGW